MNFWVPEAAAGDVDGGVTGRTGGGGGVGRSVSDFARASAGICPPGKRRNRGGGAEGILKRSKA